MGRGKGKHRLVIRDKILSLLTENNSMTVCQVFYQHVSQEIIENTEARYSSIIDELSQMRLEGIIPLKIYYIY